MNEEESAGLVKTEEEGQHGISMHSAMGKERGHSAGRDRPPLLKRRQSPSLEIELSLTKKMVSRARPEATASTKYYDEEPALRDRRAPEKAALFEQERYRVPVLRFAPFISMLILIHSVSWYFLYKTLWSVCFSELWTWRSLTVMDGPRRVLTKSCAFLPAR